MQQTLLILNGPNLNRLGLREPEIYGAETLAELDAYCEAEGRALGLRVICRQSNHEGALIDWIHGAEAEAGGIVINPAGFGHSSVALLDAVLSVPLPVIEVHLSNIHRREEFRRHTYLSGGARGVICGFGKTGYALALRAMQGIWHPAA
jgi:3-dehydroquinate dehydratase-2